MLLLRVFIFRLNKRRVRMLCLLFMRDSKAIRRETHAHFSNSDERLNRTEWRCERMWFLLLAARVHCCPMNYCWPYGKEKEQLMCSSKKRDFGFFFSKTLNSIFQITSNSSDLVRERIQEKESELNRSTRINKYSENQATSRPLNGYCCFPHQPSFFSSWFFVALFLLFFSRFSLTLPVVHCVLVFNQAAKQTRLFDIDIQQCQASSCCLRAMHVGFITFRVCHYIITIDTIGSSGTATVGSSIQFFVFSIFLGVSHTLRSLRQSWLGEQSSQWYIHRTFISFEWFYFQLYSFFLYIHLPLLARYFSVFFSVYFFFIHAPSLKLYIYLVFFCFFVRCTKNWSVVFFR